MKRIGKICCTTISFHRTSQVDPVLVRILPTHRTRFSPKNVRVPAIKLLGEGVVVVFVCYWLPESDGWCDGGGRMFTFGRKRGLGNEWVNVCWSRIISISASKNKSWAQNKYAHAYRIEVIKFSKNNPDEGMDEENSHKLLFYVNES